MEIGENIRAFVYNENLSDCEMYTPGDESGSIVPTMEELRDFYGMLAAEQKRGRKICLSKNCGVFDIGMEEGVLTDVQVIYEGDILNIKWLHVNGYSGSWGRYVVEYNVDTLTWGLAQIGGEDWVHISEFIHGTPDGRTKTQYTVIGNRWKTPNLIL